MDKQRNLLTGVVNIIRFNRGFYAAGVGSVLLLFTLAYFLDAPLKWWINGLAIAGLIPLFVSTAVSWYVYDLSGLYTLNWIQFPDARSDTTILNINAGFDETSALLQAKYPDAVLKVYDFYDPKKHTEISIERARKAFPLYPGSRQINTEHIPEANHSIDAIFLVFAAHEIRDDEERTRFFKELKRVLNAEGTVHVLEHLRDLPNFLAYTIGFFHFHPAATWQKTFSQSGFTIASASSINPFVKYYILKK